MRYATVIARLRSSRSNLNTLRLLRLRLAMTFVLVMVPLTMGGQMKTEKIVIFNAKTGQKETVETVVKADAEWKKLLTPEQY